jgi:thiol-disulfide isomerase/thioredoxin
LRPTCPPAASRRRFLTLIPLALVAIAAAHEETAAQAWPQLGSYKGKVVLLDFWASWCGPCLRSFPWMNELHLRHAAEGLMVVAVNLDQDRALAEAFLKKIPPRFRIEYDPAGAIATKFGVQAMPTSFLIDRSGRVRQRHAGFRDAQRAEREHEIELLLEEKAT